ncbi:hypothetical protein [Burkholderia sp. BCC0397]|uniref:hypothetical protein n=1 Tax=Burkholderia sp. BCC0397 TaxID=486876 RepID=UPI00158A113B|nr:hypothetical protein [Burkholderia sp. BCC0397]
MKFNAGDETDQKLCLMLRHEYLRCGEALADFKLYAQQLQRGEDSRAISYRAYNAYARRGGRANSDNRISGTARA